MSAPRNVARALCLAILSLGLASTASAASLPELGVELTRDPAPSSTPLTHSDERAVYLATVRNAASPNPNPGDELTCLGTLADGTPWFGNPAPSFTYQWLRNGSDIAGATERTYTLTEADKGKPIQCRVVGTNQSFPSGTATTEAGSNVLTDVTTATGTGTLEAGSSVIKDLTVTSGAFSFDQAISGPGIPPGTTIKFPNPVPPTVPFELHLSGPATASGPTSFTAGPQPFGEGATITGAGIPPGTSVISADGRDLTLSTNATASEAGVSISGSFPPVGSSRASSPFMVGPAPVPTMPSGSTGPAIAGTAENKAGDVLTCAAPGGWTGNSLSWSFQWLRNGVPAPHGPVENTATTSKYELQETDVNPAAIMQCEAIAKDAAGSEILVPADNVLSTSPEVPGPYSPAVAGSAPDIALPTSTTGQVTAEVELPAGAETRVNSVKGEGWSCIKLAPAPPVHAGVTCNRSDSLAPGSAYPPVEVVAQIDPNAPDTLVAKATASGGGAASPASDEDSVTVGPAVPFGFQAFKTEVLDELGADFTQAGGHPFSAGAQLTFNEHARSDPLANGTFRASNGLVKNIRTDTPPGFAGNPQALPESCARVDLVLKEACPAGSVAGGITLETDQNVFKDLPLYLLEPERGTPAQFGFAVPAVHLVFTLTAELRPTDGYAVSLVATPAPKGPELFGVKATLCSFGTKFLPKPASFKGCRKANEPGSLEIPFLSLPTRCGDPASTRTEIYADSWEDPGSYTRAEYSAPAITGCEKLSFEPELKARPTTNAADSPSGLEVDLHIPQNQDVEGTATAQLKQAVVTLPPGLVVNPSSANGLGACSPAQIGLGDNNPNSCPDSSKLGTVSAQTPILDHPLPGNLYLASPHENPFGSLLALYLVVESPDDGLVIKLAGKVDADPSTGQLTTTFDQNPQAPVEDVELKLRSGATAPLRTPQVCGKYSTTSSLTPWSAPDSGPPATPKDTYSINKGPNGSACSASEAALPNSPSFEAGTTSPLAATYSPFVLKLRREDGSQQLSQVTATPPPGLVAKLAGVLPCPEAAIAAAAARSGRDEQASPSCPAASEVGSVIAGAGAGPSPYYATGKAYLAGPYKGAPLSLAILTPAVAGPFDLGTVVVRTALHLDPRTAQVTAKSDPLPSILQGIPLDVRSVTVLMNRPSFILNPTNCDAMNISGQAISTLGQVAQLGNRFQVGECSRLPFKPSLKLRLHGPTARGGYQGMVATLTAKPGEANIASTVVTFPHSAFLAQEHIRTICTRVQFAAHACPARSIYGRATAVTPLLDQPLSGPVYLRSSSSTLPDLVIALKGPDATPIEVELAGRNDSKNGGIRNSFELVPDAPVTKFTLRLQGGTKALIVNSRNLCAGTQRATVVMGAQNGKSREFRPVVGNDCAKRGKKGRGGSKGHGSRTAKRHAQG